MIDLDFTYIYQVLGKYTEEVENYHNTRKVIEHY